MRSAILDSLKHHNIVRLIHKLSDPVAQKVYIVMEVRRTLDHVDTPVLPQWRLVWHDP